MDDMLEGILLLPVALVLGGFVSLFVAWPIMLFIGNAAIASGGLVPALGYWTTFWITWAVSIAAQ